MKRFVATLALAVILLGMSLTVFAEGGEFVQVCSPDQQASCPAEGGE